GQSGIVVGHVADGRNHEEVANSIGPYSRTLPLPYEFQPGRSFLAVMQELQNLKAAAYQQQDYLTLDESTQDLPISYVAQEKPAAHTSSGVTFSILKDEATAQRYRMQLQCVTAPGSSKLELRYDPAYFSRQAAENVAKALTVLVRNAAQNPASTIADLEIISEADRQQVVADFNRTTADFPRSQCIHYLFEEQAAARASQPALHFGETCLTYAELNARGNQLAHLLRSYGVKPDVAVGLCLDRSAEMIVALLGILKAGGAYLPLIPDNP